MKIIVNLYLVIMLSGCAAYYNKEKRRKYDSSVETLRSVSIKYRAKHDHWVYQDGYLMQDTEGLIQKSGEGWTETRNLFTGLKDKLDTTHSFSNIFFIPLNSKHIGDVAIDMDFSVVEDGQGVKKAWYFSSLFTVYIIPFWNDAVVELKAKVKSKGKKTREFNYKTTYRHVYSLIGLPILIFGENYGKVQIDARNDLIDRFIDDLKKEKFL